MKLDLDFDEIGFFVESGFDELVFYRRHISATTVGLSPNLTEGGGVPLSSLMSPLRHPSWLPGHSSDIFQSQGKRGLVDCS